MCRPPARRPSASARRRSCKLPTSSSKLPRPPAQRPGRPGAAAATAGAAAATDCAPAATAAAAAQPPQQQQTANPTGPITDDTKRQIYATAQAIFGEADWIDALAWYTAAFAKTPLAVTKTLSPDQFQEGEAQTFLAAMVKNAPVLPEYWLSAKATIIAARAGQAQPLPAQQHQHRHAAQLTRSTYDQHRSRPRRDLRTNSARSSTISEPPIPTGSLTTYQANTPPAPGCAGAAVQLDLELHMGKGGNGNITYSYTTPHITGGRVLDRSGTLQLKPKVEAIAAKLLTAYVEALPNIDTSLRMFWRDVKELPA